MPGQSKPGRPNSNHIWIDKGKVHREDGPDEKEVVPDWEQAGPWFSPDVSLNRAMKAELEAPSRTGTPVELPATPAQPPRYEDIETAGKKPPDAVKQGTPTKPERPIPRAEDIPPTDHKRPGLLKDCLEKSGERGDRPATPTEEEPGPVKDIAQNKLRGGGNGGGSGLGALRNNCEPVKKAPPKNGCKPSNLALFFACQRPMNGGDRAVLNRK